MILFINKVTGTEMWVADNRIEEYKAAGHTLAVVPDAEKKPTDIKPKKRTTKK